jgi:hypothetical protein
MYDPVKLHREIKAVLERTATTQAFTSDDFVWLQGLYQRGRTDLQQEIAGVLGIPQSLDDLT